MDPRLSLALSLQSNPGVYALLLGSGISRAAKVPTGWEVVLDLVSKIAAMEGDDPGGDPVEWYRERFDEDPDYSKLLERLAKSRDERQRLLKEYFEPSEEEREEGLKQPTAAHEAIASLCRRKYIRVIVTTNFDRLLEQALQADGLQPTVVSTADAVEGAPPLSHGELVIVKIHGDYLDTRIRNTAGELEDYPPPLARLLDRIFDEFGLVVCGWSARWDPALRAALERCSNQRYTTYWTGIENPDENLQSLLALRKAQFIPIQGADEFFVDLDEKVTALEEHARPHPLSVETAVATTKRYLPEERFRIRLHDLVSREVEGVVATVTSDRYSITDSWSEEELLRRAEAFEASSEILRSILAVGCYWTAEWHARTWRSCIERLAGVSEDTGVWDRLRRYPGTLALYTAGTSALFAGNWNVLRVLLLDAQVRESRSKDVPAVKKLQKWAVMEKDVGLSLPGMRSESSARKTPVSDRIHEVIRPALRGVIPESDRYDDAFDAFEYLLALAHADQNDRRWGPVGRFQWRREHSDGGPLVDFTRQVEDQGADWEPLRVGFFGGDPDRFKAVKEEFDELLAHARW